MSMRILRNHSLFVVALALATVGHSTSVESQSRARTWNAEARIVSVTGDKAVIDVGTERGLSPGDQAVVFYEVLQPDHTRKRVEIGTAQVTAVRSRGADVTLSKLSEAVRLGYRVRVLGKSVGPVPPPDPPVATPCTGGIVVVTVPSGAEIALTGATAPLGPNNVFAPVPCGSVEVTARLAGHVPSAKLVVVERDKVTPATLVLTPKMVTIAVGSEPSDAVVFIDGVRLGTTRWRGGVAAGSRRVRLEKDGFLPHEIVIETGEADEREFRFPLARCAGSVRVSTPSGSARVRVAGHVLEGKTPLEVRDVTCGSQDLYVQATGTDETHRRIRVEAGRATDVSVSLSPIRARLRIALTPPDSEVGFEGRRLTGSPVEITDVRSGEYPVEIRRDGYAPLKTTLIVDRSGVLDHTFTLVPVAQPAIEPPKPPRALVPISLSSIGYEAAGGLQAVLSLGILLSEYTVELNGEPVIDWRIRSTSLKKELEPGRHHLRVLIRTLIGRTPQVVHDADVMLAAGQPSEISVNFLLNQVGVNGTFEWFNGKDFRRR
jgi:hypothetical protein